MTPLTGKFCSNSLSTTPLPRPITSISISCGCSIAVQSSYKFLTAPHNCIKSIDLKVLISKTVLPCLIHSAELSPPKRATSNPHTIGALVVSATSLSMAFLASSIGMTESSSALGNSPLTSTLATVESSPYCSSIVWKSF